MAAEATSGRRRAVKNLICLLDATNGRPESTQEGIADGDLTGSSSARSALNLCSVALLILLAAAAGARIVAADLGSAQDLFRPVRPIAAEVQLLQLLFLLALDVARE